MSLVLSLFDYTGTMVKPWADAGHECIIVDIQHPAGAERVGADALRYLPPSEERANLRSATPAGFARAVFEANRARVLEPFS